MEKIKDVRKQLEAFSATQITTTDASTDEIAKFCLGSLYTIIEHIVTIDEHYKNQTTAFDSDYILRRFKELAQFYIGSIECEKIKKILGDQNVSNQ